MLIRCKQSRKHAAPGGAFHYGSTIDLTPIGSKEKKVYLFKPLDASRPDENHVCDVTDQADIAKLLAIPEGFEIHSSELARRAAPKAAKRPAPAPKPEKNDEGPADGGNGEAAAMSRGELLKAVAEKTGKRPSPATSKKKLLELLAA